MGIFNVDQNGILNVSATEKSKNITKNVTITNDSNRLSKSQIDDMLKKAEQFKDEDEKMKIKIEAKNKLENLAFRFKSSVQEEQIKSKLSPDEVQQVEQACDQVISWLDANASAEKDEFEYKTKELEQKCQGILSKVYQNGGQTADGHNARAAGRNTNGPTIEEVD